MKFCQQSDGVLGGIGALLLWLLAISELIT